MFSTAEMREVKGLRNLSKGRSQECISLLFSHRSTLIEAKISTMSDKYSSDELFQRKEELDEMLEKKKQEREEEAKEKKTGL